MKVRGNLAAAMLALALASCGNTQEAQEIEVEGAKTALEPAMYLLRGGGMETRPAALLGTYATSFLASGLSLSRTALIGAQQQIELFFEENRQENESYQLLQDFGNALAVDIPDFLNRSPDRSRSLDEYTQALKAYQAAAQRQLEALEGQYRKSQDERREKRRTVTNLQREEDKAIREKDYVTAGSLQNAISDAEEELAQTDAEERQLRNVIGLYEDALEVAEIRLNAMGLNREVLIAGVKVVDVTGIGGIGIIQGNNDRLRNRSNGGGDGFFQDL